MKFLNKLWGKARAISHEDGDAGLTSRFEATSFSTPFLRDPTSRFPPTLLAEVLSYVSPHSRDGSFTSSEESMILGGCMLCDLRDLAMYENVRIDSVHYCEREAELVAGRKRKSFSGHALESCDPALERLQLFARTTREQGYLAECVRILKLPYMTRESGKANLARTVSFLPNLQYVDLPIGVFKDSPSTTILKQELQARCPELRFMRFEAGAESTFAVFCRSHHKLEQLQLCGLNIDSRALIQNLRSLKELHNLQLTDPPLFGDEALSPALEFPPLRTLELSGLPDTTVEGLTAYAAGAGRPLKHLKLFSTGVRVDFLHRILKAFPNLRTLHISTPVSRPLLLTETPPLASSTLQTLNFDIITTGNRPQMLISPSESYYTYLADSVASGSLPSLTRLYASLPSLPAMLLQKLQETTERLHTGMEFSTPRGLGHKLFLYTKAIAEMEPDLTVIDPSAGRVSSQKATRPMSAYYPPTPSPQYAGRKSVFAGDGFGGLLTVPEQELRPASPGRRSPRKERDAWFG